MALPPAPIHHVLRTALQGIELDHFRHWLGLFETHARRLFAPEVAEAFLAVARRIAASLQYGYFGRAEVI
ncbi:MAG: hypothetical protein ACREWI_18360 [Telluria sp.]